LNRLSRETSPYLLQHQHNPVDWYPWGAEAFEAARAQDKPIFLSVGYSTCYWCHVMERQSFENEAITAEMNRLFINIKVDREERPDVDQLYMTAVQVLTRQGGWPMSVFLTPDLRPFYGGTYFPPTDAYGRPGFPTLLRALEDAYRNRRKDVEQSATQIVDILRQLAQPPAPAAPVRIDDEFVRTIIAQSIADYDPQHGGFGGAPKFPRETLLELLLTFLAQPGSTPEISNLQSQIRPMVTHTLDALANGGIRDQLGGGFHRYSTDAHWLVPHFEIMLYDNAMLAWCYVEAYRQTDQPRYAAIARGIFDFILREMTSPDGAFYTAFDAEVDAQEGLSYLWTAYEVSREFTDEPGKGMGSPFSQADADLFLRAYGLNDGPNFADPHHGNGRPDKNVLFIADPALVEQHAPLFDRMRRHLLAARKHRKQPLLDTKIITSWNALMIRALAYGGQVLKEQRYLDAAARAAEFLLTRHRTADDGLYRTSRDGVAKHAAFLDDYAFLLQAMLALHDAGGADARWREAAASLAEVMSRKFGDDAGGGFFFTEANTADLIVRQKVASDSPLPSGNAVAAMAMLALGDTEQARHTIAAFATQLEANGEGMSSMVQAALVYLRNHERFTVSGHGAAAAADRPLKPQQVAGGVVSLRSEWAAPTLLSIHISVLNGFHINAHEASAGLLATQLSISGDAASKIAGIDYPPGELRRFAFADEEIRVYDGDVEIVVRLSSPPAGAVQLALRYQACDDSACLPPVTKTLDVPPAT
jgi:uncharacterized protein YyaL (SSP411 family)